MEWFIKKNATLPTLKVKVNKDGRSQYVNNMSMLGESNVYFSMTDTETGIPKISTKSAVVTTGLTSSGNIEYYTYYQFTKRETKKVGRFLAEFMVVNNDGVLYQPIVDKLYINITDSFAIDDVDFEDDYTISFPCCN
jgi:hypothetical protein